MKKRTILSVIMLMTMGFSACTNTQNHEEKVGDTQVQQASDTKNLISIVEISITDFTRAVTFYQEILDVTIEEIEMDGNKMGILPNEEGTVNVVLVKGNDYKPTADGTILYLNAGKNLQPILDKIEKHGGQVILPKTEISPEMGYFALFIDTEGNKLGLHSSQ